MTSGASSLLALLGSGVRPVDTGARASAAEPAEGFAALLDRAKAGEVASGLPVLVDSSLDLDLNDQQLAQLAEGADRATAAGADRALLTLDGRGYVLDVGSRTITATFDPGGRSTLVGIDAVIGVDAEEDTDATGKLGAPLAWRSPSLLRALERDVPAG